MHVLVVPRAHVATLNDLGPGHDALVGTMVRRAAAIAARTRLRRPRLSHGVQLQRRGRPDGVPPAPARARRTHAGLAAGVRGSAARMKAMFLRHEGFRRLCAARDCCATSPTTLRSVAAVARQLGVSPFHFIRQFAAMFGTTPHQFRTDARTRTRATPAGAGPLGDRRVHGSRLLEPGQLQRCSLRDALGESPSRFQRRMRALEPRPRRGAGRAHAWLSDIDGRVAPSAAFRNSREA